MSSKQLLSFVYKDAGQSKVCTYFSFLAVEGWLLFEREEASIPALMFLKLVLSDDE